MLERLTPLLVDLQEKRLKSTYEVVLSERKSYTSTGWKDYAEKRFFIGEKSALKNCGKSFDIALAIQYNPNAFYADPLSYSEVFGRWSKSDMNSLVSRYYGSYYADDEKRGLTFYFIMNGRVLKRQVKRIKEEAKKISKNIHTQEDFEDDFYFLDPNRYTEKPIYCGENFILEIAKPSTTREIMGALKGIRRQKELITHVDYSGLGSLLREYRKL